MSAPTTPVDVRAALPPDAAAALDDMLRRIEEAPETVGRYFPAAARRTTRGDIGLRDDHGEVVLAEDAVRVALLRAAVGALPATRGGAEVAALYRFGDSDEKRAVLLGLGVVDSAAAPDVLEDALRTNDTRLVAAAMGPPAARLDADTWRQGVLKCLFVGVALTSVADLRVRADRSLAEMVARYAHERVAAGRDVPADVWLVLDRFPEAVALIDLDTELASPHDDRSDAARRLLASRPTTPKD
ncbi:EboA domain-containing protein [Solicola gregarius]|uniref:EboA domain-containing protein n=1 Tax=Solicola gregarius TaxID=2908642 RepID=A0AA46YLZ9_9ACTN|nr:EboA domain-containing protein [Solicola gregarius]UYM07485.1 EboA domain-containing protein [Solicola gregarius]